MASIQTGIELNDQFSSVLNNIVDSVNMAISAMTDMNESMNANVDTRSLETARDKIDEAAAGIRQMDENLQTIPGSVQKATQGTQNLSNELQNANKHAGNLSGTLMKAATAFVSLATARKVFNYIGKAMDAYNTQLNAETQLMTVLANMMDEDVVAKYMVEVGADTSEAIAEINAIGDQVGDIDVGLNLQTAALQNEYDKIINKASEIQDTGIYGDEAMIAGAAELATYFTDIDAITSMMDTLSNYAAGMTGGGAVDAKTMTDYATNLGKIMTGSYDAMTKKGFEFTDAQKAIIEGTASEIQIAQQLGDEYLDMSSDMQAAAAIAQVIDEAWGDMYQTMSDTPEGKIISLNNAFGDMLEVIGGELYPYVIAFVDCINENWPTIEQIVQGIVGALQVLMEIMGTVMDIAIQVAQVIIDNWSWIGPIVEGVVLAMTAYAVISGIVAIATGIAAAAHGIYATACAIAEAAQMGFNAALAACPITWILVAIIAVIAAIYAICSAIAKLTGVANSGFAVITGGIAVVGAFFQNLFYLVMDIAIGIGNAISALAQNMMTAFSNAISGIQSWFYNLLSTALSVISQIASALNALPFVSFDFSGITSMAADYAGKAEAAAANKGEYVSISDAFNSGASTYSAFDSGWASTAFKSGSEWGDNLLSSIGSSFSVDTSGFKSGGGLSAADFTSSMGNALNNSDIADALGSGGSGGGGIGGSSGRTADNTGAISDKLDISNEDLKYLRDIAEQEAVNRYTLATVNVDQSGMVNQITNGEDINTFMNQLTDAVNEAVDTMTAGVHT